MGNLRLNPSASITPTRDAVILRSDLGAFSIAGADLQAFVSRIVPVLDGSKDRAGIERALSSYSPKSISAFLDLLRTRGLVEDVPVAAPDRLRGQHEFLKRSGARWSLGNARVAVVGKTPWGASAALALTASGLDAIDWLDDDCAIPADPPALLIATIDPSDRSAVTRISRAAHEARVRSLWAHQAGATSMLGPLVVPGKTACRLCATVDVLSPTIPAHKGTYGSDILGTMLALEAIKAITEYTPSSLAGRMSIQDLSTFETRLHKLVRIPWCSACGSR